MNTSRAKNWTRRRDLHPRLSALLAGPLLLGYAAIAVSSRSLGAGRFLRRPPSMTDGKDLIAEFGLRIGDWRTRKKTAEG